MADACDGGDLLCGARVGDRDGESFWVGGGPFRVAMRVQVIGVGGDDVLGGGEFMADFFEGLGGVLVDR